MTSDPNELGETSAMDLTDRRRVEDIMQVGGPFIPLARALLAHDNYLVNLSDRIEALLGLDDDDDGRDDDVQPVSPDPEPEHVTCPTCKGRGTACAACSLGRPFDHPCGRCGGEGRLRVWVAFVDGSRWVESGQVRLPVSDDRYLINERVARSAGGHHWRCPHPILVPAPAPDPEHHNTPAGVREDRSEEDEPRTTTYQDLEGGIDSTGTSYPDSDPSARSGGSPERPDWWMDREWVEQWKHDLSRGATANALARQADALTEAGKALVRMLGDWGDADHDPAQAARFLTDPAARWALHNLTDEAG